MTKQSDAQRLARVFRSRPGQKLSMLWLRREFPGGLTQRMTELKRSGMAIVNIKRTVKGKTHSAYVYQPEGR